MLVPCSFCRIAVKTLEYVGVEIKLHLTNTSVIPNFFSVVTFKLATYALGIQIAFTFEYELPPAASLDCLVLLLFVIFELLVVLEELGIVVLLEFVILVLFCCISLVLVIFPVGFPVAAYMLFMLSNAKLKIISIVNNIRFVILPPPYPKNTPTKFHNLRKQFLKV